MGRLLSPRFIVLMFICLPIAAVILGIMACLPVPVGDPETSKVDAKFTGAWVMSGSTDPAKAKDDDEDKDKRQLYIVTPWDSRTYLVHFYAYQEKDGGIVAGTSGSYKAWLTPFGDKTIVTLDPKPIAKQLGWSSGDRDKFFVVGKLTAVENGLEMLMANPDNGPLKDIKTREQAETIIKEHVDDAEMYVDSPFKLQKLDEAKVKSILEAFHAE